MFYVELNINSDWSSGTKHGMPNWTVYKRNRKFPAIRTDLPRRGKCPRDDHRARLHDRDRPPVQFL